MPGQREEGSGHRLARATLDPPGNARSVGRTRSGNSGFRATPGPRGEGASRNRLRRSPEKRLPLARVRRSTPHPAVTAVVVRSIAGLASVRIGGEPREKPGPQRTLGAGLSLSCFRETRFLEALRIPYTRPVHPSCPGRSGPERSAKLLSRNRRSTPRRLRRATGSCPQDRPQGRDKSRSEVKP